MRKPRLPMIVEPKALKPLLETDKIMLVDLSNPQTYVQRHLPGAVFLEYNWIVNSEKPRNGLLPNADQLGRVFASLGLTPDTHVVSYDDEGGGRASRFLWTLACVGHTKVSLLNGGLHAWTDKGRPLSQKIRYPTPVEYKAQLVDGPIADKQFILEHLHDDNVIVLDARSPQEYSGTKVFAQRGGHIPGAVNLEWTEVMDQDRQLRLKSAEQISALLDARGVSPDKTIVVHCQTHHRSAHTYMVLKSLGYEKVKGYPGSWSDWGNDPSTPVET